MDRCVPISSDLPATQSIDQAGLQAHKLPFINHGLTEKQDIGTSGDPIESAQSDSNPEAGAVSSLGLPQRELHKCGWQVLQTHRSQK